MKKNPLIYFGLLFFFNICAAQQFDFNLYNPTNEFYLFSSYDEGADAFRYNPAVLGLKHRFNFSLGMLIEKGKNQVRINETDILLNSGIIGIAYRGAAARNLFRSEQNVHTISIGLGFGNKGFTFGVLGEYVIQEQKNNRIDQFGTYSPRVKGTIGVLIRPNEYMSFSLVAKYRDVLSKYNVLSSKVYGGLALRPLKKDFLTLLAEGGVVPYEGEDIFKFNFYKAGIDLKVISGLHLNLSYFRINDIIRQNFFNLGFRFELPHVNLRNNNVFAKETGFWNEDKKFFYSGSNLTFSYTSEKKESVIEERDRVFEITLSGNLQDYHTDDVFFGLLGRGKRSIHEIIADIDFAAKDESVKGILLKIYPLSTGRFEINAAIEELARNMTGFRTTGKDITAYFAQDAGPAEYYIATFADRIIMPPEAILFYGLSINVFNYKQFLEKYGVELQTFYAGRYKLTFQGLVDSTTAEGREVIDRILDIVYEKMLSRISDGRKLVVDDFLRKKLSQPLSGVEAKKLGLVDANGWYDYAKNEAEKKAGLEDATVKRLHRTVWDEVWGEPDRIAVIGVYGSITTGESEAPGPVRLPIPFVGGGRSTGSETVIRQLEDAFSNPKVKAVILRVDSGGGSALASAEINDAIIRLKKKFKKLFIVSMGGAAASGGYEVSVNADRIFSDELTVTGSIGVWTARPNIDSLLKSQRIKVETFKRGENSDISSIYKHLNEEEINIIQGLINFYYDRFIESVAEGRNLSKEEVENAAEGRVLLGKDAFNKKLVDEIGGLYEAINYASKKTDKRFKLVYYAVPGGETISEIVTSSVLQYFQRNLEKLFGLEEEEDIEIKN